MKVMAERKLVKGLSDKLGDLPFCEACAEGEQQRSPFPSRAAASASTRALELLHTDLMGPIHPPSVVGARWVMVVVDDWTRLTWMWALTNKSDVTGRLQAFIVTAKAVKPNRPIAFLRTDNGTEYVNAGMQAMLAEHGITHQTTTPYSPESSGLAERTNRTLTEMARAMLHGRKLDLRLWAEAIQTVTYLNNRSPSAALPGRITPFQRWNGTAAEVMNLRVFESPAWCISRRRGETGSGQPGQRSIYSSAMSIKALTVGETPREAPLCALTTCCLLRFDDQRAHFDEHSKLKTSP